MDVDDARCGVAGQDGEAGAGTIADDDGIWIDGAGAGASLLCDQRQTPFRPHELRCRDDIRATKPDADDASGQDAEHQCRLTFHIN